MTLLVSDQMVYHSGISPSGPSEFLRRDSAKTLGLFFCARVFLGSLGKNPYPGLGTGRRVRAAKDCDASPETTVNTFQLAGRRGAAIARLLSLCPMGERGGGIARTL